MNLEESKERYRKDPHFASVVEIIFTLLYEGKTTVQELRDATNVAALKALDVSGVFVGHGGFGPMVSGRPVQISPDLIRHPSVRTGNAEGSATKSGHQEGNPETKGHSSPCLRVFRDETSQPTLCGLTAGHSGDHAWRGDLPGGPIPAAGSGRLCDMAWEVNRINRANGWAVLKPDEWESDPYKIPGVLALIHSEVSEALEAYRKGDHENFAEEIADTLIRVLDCAGGLGIDIDQAVEIKLEKNRKRGYKHGGKRV